MQNKKILNLIDLTSLNENDTEETTAALCEKAVTQFGSVAAVCVYPKFVKQAVQLLKESSVKIATVVNFPQGNDPLDVVINTIQQSIQDGAQEIDVVFPYTRFLGGETEFASDYIKQCKKTCGKKVLLKVILESGAFSDSQMLANASHVALLAGADFLKTSSGKISVGATLQAAKTMLIAIKEMSPQLNRPLGFKVSGGVRTIDQSNQYIALSGEIMGAGWVTPQTFRIGASQLLDAVIKELAE